MQTYQIRRCPQCASTEHRVRNCPSFQKLDPSTRYQVAKKATLCFNCLADNHTVSECKSKSNCFNCKSRHYTLLCRKTNRSRKSSTSSEDNASSYYTTKKKSTKHKKDSSGTLVCVPDGKPKGVYPSLRAYLCYGSKGN